MNRFFIGLDRAFSRSQELLSEVSEVKPQWLKIKHYVDALKAELEGDTDTVWLSVQFLVLLPPLLGYMSQQGGGGNTRNWTDIII